MSENLYIKTYGCQSNVYDSLYIENILKALGYRICNSYEEANLIIFNTCNIREKATEKLYSELGAIKKRKRLQNLDSLIIVAGCIAQAEGEEVFKRSGNVDIIVGPQSLHELPELIIKYKKEKNHLSALNFSVISKFDYLPEEQSRQGVSAFLSIQEGCDKFCTFCCVPYTRGPEYSRPVQQVYNEALKLVENGSREIVLLGQNVTAYHGKNIDGETWSMGKLLKLITSIKDIERVSYSSSHPADMHDELYEAHEHEEKLTPFLHLPVQSGSNKVLKRMNRKYTKEQYLDIIYKLRSIRPDIEFGSDIIVGFPGETDEDIEETADLIKKAGFVRCYSFAYSKRFGTPGAEYRDQIVDKIKFERLYYIQKIINDQQYKFNRSMTDRVLPVLIFGEGRGKNIWGKTVYMQTVRLLDNKLEKKYFNSIVPVKIKAGFANSLYGEALV